MSGSRLGAYDPATRIEEGAIALALRTPEGAASVAVAQRNGTLEVQGWGDGARWLVPHLPGLLGLEDDPSSFTPEDGVVRKLKRQFSGTHLPKFPRIFDRVVRVTLLQVVTWQEACRSWGRLVRELGEDSKGPQDVRLPPSAETLKSTPDYALIALGIRPKQARTILRIAKYASVWIPHSPSTPEMVRGDWELIQTFMADSGRPAAALGKAYCNFVYVLKKGEKPEAANPKFSMISGMDLDFWRKHYLVGEAEELAERIGARIEAFGGCEHLIMNPVDWSMEQLDLLAGDVLPRVVEGLEQ